MNRKRLFAFSLIVSVSLLAGCFQFQPRLLLNQRTENLDKEFQMGRYVPKVDNFFIILDASTSMSVSYKNEGEDSKFNVAKDFIKRMNNTMPQMNINGSLLTFGRGIKTPIRQTETVYGPTLHSRSGMEQSLNDLSFPAEGNSPAGSAIRAVNRSIGAVKGDNAVILISDGEHLEDDPRGRVRILEDRYGERTCFYTVWIGNDPKGKVFMEEIASQSQCGFSVSADETMDGEEMVGFVKQVFLTTDTGRESNIDIDSDGDGVLDSDDRCPDTPFGVEVERFGCPKVKRMDSDRDGVYDDSDNCPGTPIGVEVDSFGCPVIEKDSDGDGVLDSDDRCPDTPFGVEVDRFGCPKISQIDSDGDGVYDNSDECPGTPAGAIVDERGCWVVKGVQFDYKKWDVKPQFNSNLDNIENILKKNPGLRVRIEGHTDDIGSMKYNIGLSGKRAQAIMDYLVDKGIDSSRITTTGLGYAQPIADNDTPEGRALNRRAEIIPVK
jgi:OOP family OmpA-OmpF porin